MFEVQNISGVTNLAHTATMWILALASVLSVAAIIEKWISLSKLRDKTVVFNKKFVNAIRANDKDLTRSLLTSTAPYNQFIASGIKPLKTSGEKALEHSFDLQNLQAISHMEKSMNFLATVGANAPFIGLLGTVFGIMEAFGALAEPSNQAYVMSAISQALLATALGLLVALPAVIAFNYFKNQIRIIMQSIESTQKFCVMNAKYIRGLL